MREYSDYQKKVIGRYYENRDQTDRTRLAELCTSLYLATPKQAVRYWETVETILERLEIPKSRIAHTLKSKDPTVLAAIVNDLEKGKL